jgi:hypothetical protein
MTFDTLAESSTLQPIVVVYGLVWPGRAHDVSVHNFLNSMWTHVELLENLLGPWHAFINLGKRTNACTLFCMAALLPTVAFV